MKKLTILIAAVLMSSVGVSWAGEENAGGGTNRGTTVKSGKSNSSDRAGAPDSGGASEATTVKSSKSNSSERAGAPADDATTVKGSKSNSSER